MQKKHFLTSPLMNNVLWFIASLAVASSIWIAATFDRNPVEQRQFNSLPIQVLLDDHVILVESASPRTTTARVTLSAQRSVLTALTLSANTEIIVRADLRGLEPGVHTISLEVEPLRPAALVDIQPLRVEYEIDRIEQRLVPVNVTVASEPPVGYERTSPQPAISEVLISGAASAVNRVVSAVVALDLSQQRETFTQTVALTPVDADGQTVSSVQIEPSAIEVTVQITTPDDVRPIPVTLDINTTTLADGYVLTSATRYEPEIVLVTGPPELLANLTILRTAPISLEGRTEDFQVNVPVVLPNSRLSLVGEETTINVYVGIAVRRDSRQFQDVRVEAFGLTPGYTIEITPAEVSVLLTGAQPMIVDLELGDVVAIINVEGLSPGIYQIAPSVAVNLVQVESENISVFPSDVEVRIINPADATEPPTEEPNGTSP